jgi:hypothetical protein
MPAKIFVNYRREDAGAQAARIRDRLVGSFGAANVFMDVDNLRPGQRFDKELTKALDGCDAFIAVIGPRWYDLLYARAQTGGHVYVREELGTALAREMPVIPILIDQATLPRSEGLPDDLRPLVLHQAHQIRHEHFGRDTDALISTIRAAQNEVRYDLRERPPIEWRRVGLMLSVVGAVGAYIYWFDVDTAASSNDFDYAFRFCGQHFKSNILERCFGEAGETAAGVPPPLFATRGSCYRRTYTRSVLLALGVQTQFKAYRYCGLCAVGDRRCVLDLEYVL